MKSLLFGKVVLDVGDITKESVDAIVNAANSSLMGGGGVDGAIHRAGGIEILNECRKIRETLYPSGLPTGKAVATTGGKLKAKYVIHTVGPVWYGGKNNEDDLLENAYINSLKEAEKLNIKSIAFPAISTGVYGFPKDRAAKIVSKVLKNYFTNGARLELVKLIFFNKEDCDIFIKNSDLS